MSVSGATTTTTAYYGTLALSVNGALSYTLNDGLGSVAESLNSSGVVTATQLYSPYGNVRYSSGALPTSYGYTHQRMDTVSGLAYYGARYYDPVAGQFTSADTTLAGGLNRYAYVSGNPETATDPTGHRYVRPTGGGASPSSGGGHSSRPRGATHHSARHSSGGGHSVWNAIGSFAWQALDATTGIPSMISDVKTLVNGKASLTQKLFAGADLAFNIVMDVTMVIGVGEGLRAAYEGVRIGAHIAADVAEHAAEHDAEAALERTGEQAATDAVDAVAAECGLSFAASTLVATPSGERAIASLAVGQRVTAYDPTTGKTTTRTITRLFLNHDTDRLDVTLALPTALATQALQAVQAVATARSQTARGHGRQAPGQLTTQTAAATTPQAATEEVIHTTANHPWLSADRGWLVAGNLRVGEPVRLLDGATARVARLQALPGVGPMWDLALDATHTFAVGAAQAVVHNCGNAGANTARAKGLLGALRNAGADVSHVTVGVGNAADGSLLVSLNQRVAETGATDLTDKTAGTLQNIIKQGNWAKQGMTYVGPEMLQSAGTSFESLIHAEPYLMDSGAVADTVGVSLASGPCAACKILLGR